MAAPPLIPHRPAVRATVGGLVVGDGLMTPYDFQRPSKLPREYVHILQGVFEAFAHRLAVLLTSHLRVVCRITPTGVEQATAVEHLEMLTGPMVLAPLTLEPLPGTAVLGLTRDTAMRCLDLLLGGSGGLIQPQRPLSDIETPLLRELLSAALVELGAALTEIVTVTPVLQQLEYDPLLMLNGELSETVIAATFDLSIGTKSNQVSLCLPMSSLLPALQRHHAQTGISPIERAAREAARQLVTDQLHDIPIEVSVRFDSVRLQSTELLDLRPGDVLSLDHPVTHPLAITTAGAVFGRAVATRRGPMLACRVVDTGDYEENRP